MSSSHIGFHEATLIGVRRVSTETIRLSLEGVRIGEEPKNVFLSLAGIGRILRDGVPIPEFTMELPDAEVLTLKINPGSLRTILEWNDFSDRRQETHEYVIECEDVAIEIVDSS